MRDEPTGVAREPSPTFSQVIHLKIDDIFEGHSFSPSCFLSILVPWHDQAVEEMQNLLHEVGFVNIDVQVHTVKMHSHIIIFFRVCLTLDSVALH